MNQANNSNTNVVTITLTDAQLTRLLNIQETGKSKWNETCEHAFELGMRSREHSIAAQAKRKSSEELVANTARFNTWLLANPKQAANPEMLVAMMRAFLVVPKVVEQIASIDEAASTTA